ncbi:GMC family oxidoreductase [Ottowia sp. VDI28]|uniref:GMC family oxidoreductase n=1 Tax=Ottowia sp. VDI28 TaxID=3133968 RepID=UPI003C2F4F4B
MLDCYDFIIVGAGTSGSVLANRLSEDPSRSVLLVEAGPRPRGLWVNMPAGVSKLIFPGPYNWGFHTEPEPELAGRRIYAPRGRGLGGSSLINGMAFFRAQPQDYEDWKALGVQGWGWSDLLPLFRKIERRDEGTSTQRGRSGELHITDPLYVHESTRDFMHAAQGMGVRANADFNEEGADGVGLIQFNIDKGERHSADKAFLYPAMRTRPNLTVLTDAQVARVLLDEQRTATGIEVRPTGAPLRQIRCRREVILCAGAFGSPQLLLNSGVGPEDALREAGVPVRHALRGVGHNLQDHMYIHHTFACDDAASLNAQFRGARSILRGVQYLLTKQGPLTTGASQACAFVRSSQAVSRPDLQICFRPVSWVFTPAGSMEIGKNPELTVSVCNLRPDSRGQVKLAGHDPFEAPRIHANYLRAPRDQAVAISSVRTVRKIFEQAPLAQRVRAELAPGQAAQSDEQILDYVRQTAQSMHHWAGTCKMGTDEESVVDSELRVHGIRHLRVADCSILPRIVSANTNAISFVVGEKASTFIS